MKTRRLTHSLIYLGPALLLAFVCSVASTPAQLLPQTSPPHYVVTDIGSPSEFDFLYRVQINNNGDILGDGDASTGPYADAPHSVLYRRGKFIDLHLLTPQPEILDDSFSVALNDRCEVLFRVGGMKNTFYYYHNGLPKEFSHYTHCDGLEPAAINNGGDIVGISGSYETGEAFLFSHHRVRLLGKLPGFPASAATRISDAGHILGLAMDKQTQTYRAVLFTAGGVVDLGAMFGLPVSFGSDINSHGDVVGSAAIDGYGSGPVYWLWQEGHLTYLTFQPAALNNSGQVVGSVPGWPGVPYLYCNGTTYNLNDLIDSDWQLLQANDINDLGQIVGWGRFNGTWRGFLLTPTTSSQTTQ